jgi:hypothetical protein
MEDMEDAYIAILRLKKPAKRWTQDELEKEIDLEFVTQNYGLLID